MLFKENITLPKIKYSILVQIINTEYNVTDTGNNGILLTIKNLNENNEVIVNTLDTLKYINVPEIYNHDTYLVHMGYSDEEYWLLENRTDTTKKIQIHPWLENCVCCGTKLIGVYCYNHTCKARLMKSILLYLNIALNLHPSTSELLILDILVKRGFINKISDLYKLKNIVSEISSICETDLGTLNTFLANIKNSKVELYSLLCSFNIEKNSKWYIDKFQLDFVYKDINMFINEFVTNIFTNDLATNYIDNNIMSYEAATSILNYLCVNDNYQDILELISYGIF